ncbi:MAG: hypothetical protein M1839_009457 [Geoglossum umbratile]|nr:MAG: hypothetical protein M1839_009457 [Geoglossum umbratile]
MASSSSPPPNAGPIAKLHSTFEQFEALLKQKMRPPPPQFGDGKYEEEAVPESVPTGLAKDLESLGFDVPKDLGTLIELIEAQIKGVTDDKTYLMERIIQIAAKLPATSRNGQKLTGRLISQIWTSLQHPPLSYVGPQFQYRMADGSNNNILYPQIGKAGTPYAKTVKSLTQLPVPAPDAGTVFDALMRRKGYREHPTRISSELYYLATIIIHDIFDTDRKDYSISNTSSYLDLAPLYGNNQKEQAAVRTFADGKLKPDAFSEKRILGFPPGVSALLVTFNRFHNYVVDNLAAINEGGRFSGPDKSKRDNDLFQTGRLITCGLYVNIILVDYLRAILNLGRTTSTWSLDPRVNNNNIFDAQGTPKGIGNQVSVEFNLIYRWHSCISKRDEKWTEDFFKTNFPNVDPQKASPRELGAALMAWDATIDQDPGKRVFGGLKRTGADGAGPFKDEELVKIIYEGIEDTAAAFGANGVPAVMRAIEVLGIEQSRAWKVASLNEFRAFFGLQKHKTFEDINSDPGVANTLRELYDHPDFVEMYPGMVVEEPKIPMVPGSGLCPGYTISRAVLSDAVALVRGDRFYTVDYTTSNLTNWGMAEVASDTSVAYGGVIYKLFLRAFPKHMSPNSVYTMFPFTIPSENRAILSSIGVADKYTYERSPYIPDPLVVRTYKATTAVLGDSKNYTVTWGDHIRELTGGRQFMLSGDGPWFTQQHATIGSAIYSPKNHKKEIFDYFQSTTAKLLKKKGYQLGDRWRVDAVRDIGNVVPVRFTSEFFSLPLKTDEHPDGIFTEYEMYMVFAVAFAYIFLDMDPGKHFQLKEAAVSLSQQLTKLVTLNVKDVEDDTFLEKMVAQFKPVRKELASYGAHLIKRLLEGGKKVDEVVWEIMPTAAAGCANQAQAFAQLLDVYLSEPYYTKHWHEIVALSRVDTVDADQKLRKYALEGMRLNPQAFGAYRWAQSDGLTIQDGEKKITPKKGDKVFVSFYAAGADPSVFPDPKEVKLDRDEGLYILYGHGPHICLGKELNITAMTGMLKAFARHLKGLRRAPGLQGQMKYILKDGLAKVYMKEDWSAWWPYPTTMKVEYDGWVD